jgi:cell wall-associated protease
MSMKTKSAGIIKSYYPKLKANLIKDILLQTRVQYNIELSMKDSLDNKISIPFNGLFKAGTIVNVYNTLVIAESSSKS